MNFVNHNHDSISTVQLSPFGEEQWNRIITYSPIYVHWTDMLMISQQRTNKPHSAKLNSKDQIDLNTMKLEDEILLNQLYQFRRAGTIPSKGKNSEQGSKVLDEEQDQNTASLIEDYRGSSEFFREPTESVKQPSIYVEPSFAQQSYTMKRSASINQTNPSSLNGHIQTNKFPNLNFGPKPQPSLGVQLRQSAIAREHVLSAAYDRQLPSPLSMASSKRTITSAYLNYRNQFQQPPPPQRKVESPSSRTSSYAHQQYVRESPPPSAKRTRAKSTTSSRSTMHMLQTKNNRIRQKQNVDLKTVLVEPWKQVLTSDDILDGTIPNSLEIMHKMCGPATPFEQNLRYTFRRQLTQFRNGSTKP